MSSEEKMEPIDPDKIPDKCVFIKDQSKHLEPTELFNVLTEILHQFLAKKDEGLVKFVPVEFLGFLVDALEQLHSQGIDNIFFSLAKIICECESVSEYVLPLSVREVLALSKNENKEAQDSAKSQKEVPLKQANKEAESHSNPQTNARTSDHSPEHDVKEEQDGGSDKDNELGDARLADDTGNSQTDVPVTSCADSGEPNNIKQESAKNRNKGRLQRKTTAKSRMRRLLPKPDDYDQDDDAFDFDNKKEYNEFKVVKELETGPPVKAADKQERKVIEKSEYCLVTREGRLYTYECQLCSMSFRWRVDIRRHIKQHRRNWLICRKCRKRFPTQVELDEHLKNHDPFLCNYCGKGYQSKTGLKHHVDFTHSEELVKHKCPMCGKQLITKNSLDRHIDVVHRNIRPHVCDVCGEGFPDSSTLKKHQYAHTGEKPFSCDECSEAFVTSNNLKMHKIKKHGKPEECAICKQHFQTSLQLYHHEQKVHKKRKRSKRKPVVCDICGRSLVDASLLKKHIEIVHMKIRPFKCTVCAKSCSSQSQLKEHMGVHDRIPRFHCQYCGEGFIHRATYKKHVFVHEHGKEQCKCPVCNKGFDTPLHLAEHVRGVHRDMEVQLPKYSMPKCTLPNMYRNPDRQLVDEEETQITPSVVPSGQAHEDSRSTGCKRIRKRKKRANNITYGDQVQISVKHAEEKKMALESTSPNTVQNVSIPAFSTAPVTHITPAEARVPPAVYAEPRHVVYSHTSHNHPPHPHHPHHPHNVLDNGAANYSMANELVDLGTNVPYHLGTHADAHLFMMRR